MTLLRRCLLIRKKTKLDLAFTNNNTGKTESCPFKKVQCVIRIGDKNKKAGKSALKQFRKNAKPPRATHPNVIASINKFRNDELVLDAINGSTATDTSDADNSDTKTDNSSATTPTTMTNTNGDTANNNDTAPETTTSNINSANERRGFNDTFNAHKKEMGHRAPFHLKKDTQDDKEIFQKLATDVSL